jgi:hypothetical protein
VVKLRHKLPDTAQTPGAVGCLLGGERTPAADGPAYIDDLIDSATLDGLDVQHRWLVREVLVADQPAILGGPKKTPKTSVVIGLAISLASGTPFLGRFGVEAPVRVAVFSAERDLAPLRDTARRVCAARHLSLPHLNILWSCQLPRRAARTTWPPGRRSTGTRSAWWSSTRSTWRCSPATAPRTRPTALRWGPCCSTPPGGAWPPARRRSSSTIRAVQASDSRPRTACT